VKAHIAIGIAVTIAIGTLLQALANSVLPVAASVTDPETMFRSLAISSGAICFISVTAGSMVAKGRFLWAAIGLWGAAWIAILYILARIADPIEPTTMVQVASNNWLGILATLIASISGAFLGKLIYSYLTNSRSAVAS